MSKRNWRHNFPFVSFKMSYAAKFLRFNDAGELDEKKTRQAIEDRYDFAHAYRAPKGELTKFMTEVKDYEHYRFKEALENFDQQWLTVVYKETLARYGVDCAEKFVEEHSFGYGQHMADNYGISAEEARMFLVFSGGFEWENLAAYKRFGEDFLDQAVSVCEENEDEENLLDKKAIEDWTQAKRKEERGGGKRAKFEI